MAKLAHKIAVRDIFRRGLAVILFTLSFSNAKAADDSDGPGSFRASLYAGAFIPQSQSWNGSGLLGGLPFNATGKLSSNTGWATGLLLGYSFQDTPGLEWLNIDLAAGYVSSSFDHFNGTVAIPGAGNFTGPDPLVGDYHTVAGFVNFLATPFGIRRLFDNKVTPFIGIGPGIAGSTARIRSFTVAGMTLPVNVTSSETDFAFDAVLGADYEIAPHWDLGLAYQYTQIEAKHLGSGAGITANTGSAFGHSIGLVLEYRFH